MKNNTIKIIIIASIIGGIVLIGGIVALVSLINSSSDKESKKSQSSLLDINEEAKEEKEDTRESLEDSEIEAFNARFNVYEGDSVSGSNVNRLLEVIGESNEQNEEHRIRALANVQHWDSDNNRPDFESNYKITYEKDDDGYINIIKIEDAEN